MSKWQWNKNSLKYFEKLKNIWKWVKLLARLFFCFQKKSSLSFSFVFICRSAFCSRFQCTKFIYSIHSICFLTIVCRIWNMIVHKLFKIHIVTTTKHQNNTLFRQLLRNMFWTEHDNNYFRLSRFHIFSVWPESFPNKTKIVIKRLTKHYDKTIRTDNLFL